MKEWQKLCKRYAINNLERKHQPRSAASRVTGNNENSQSEADVPPDEYEVERLVDICYGDPSKTGERGLKFKVLHKSFFQIYFLYFQFYSYHCLYHHLWYFSICIFWHLFNIVVWWRWFSTHSCFVRCTGRVIVQVKIHGNRLKAWGIFELIFNFFLELVVTSLHGISSGIAQNGYGNL